MFSSFVVPARTWVLFLKCFEFVQFAVFHFYRYARVPKTAIQHIVAVGGKCLNGFLPGFSYFLTNLGVNAWNTPATSAEIMSWPSASMPAPILYTGIINVSLMIPHACLRGHGCHQQGKCPAS